MNDTVVAKKPIKLVVSDVDGTLVTRDKRVTDRVTQTLAALDELGVAFTIISARPPLGVHRLVEKLDLAGPVGAVNGGALIRADLTIIERKFLPEGAARAAIRFLREQGIDPWVFTETEWFLRDPDGSHVEHERSTLAMDFRQEDDISDETSRHVLKIVGASHDHGHLARCETELQALLGATASATRSQSYYLDITHPEAIKGEGLAGLARLLDLDLDCVLAIGDGTNDISMLQRAGFSVAMGNASDLVKGHATVTTADCDDEGFAKAVERYVLQDPRQQRTSARPSVHEERVQPEDAPH